MPETAEDTVTKWTGVLAELNVSTTDGRYIAQDVPYEPRVWGKGLPLYWTQNPYGDPPIVLGGQILRTWSAPDDEVPLALYGSGTISSPKLADYMTQGFTPFIRVALAPARYHRETINGQTVIVASDWTIVAATAYAGDWPRFLNAKIKAA